jgi:hypothetical protein
MVGDGSMREQSSLYRPREWWSEPVHTTLPLLSSIHVDVASKWQVKELSWQRRVTDIKRIAASGTYKAICRANLSLMMVLTPVVLIELPWKLRIARGEMGVNDMKSSRTGLMWMLAPVSEYRS